MNTIEQTHARKIEAFTSTFSDTQSICVYKNLASTFLYVNPFCLKFLGYTKENQVLGKTDYDFLWNDYADLYKKEEETVIDVGSYISLVPSINRHGEEVLFFSTREVVKDSSGRAVGILCQAKSVINKEILELSNLLNINLKVKEKATLTFEDNFNSQLKLTKRERECLFFLVRGYSAKMIANIFFLTERAIEAHVERIKYKFNVNSKFELIAKAIHMGYLYDIPHSLFKKRSKQFLTC